MKDYGLFRNYFEVLRPLLQAAVELATMLPGDYERGLHVSHSELSAARIRGNFVNFEKSHGCLLTFLGGTLWEAGRTKLWPNGQTAFTAEELARGITHRTKALEAILPKKVDVSSYGYNEADAQLAEYRRDREGFVMYGSKPKRSEENREPKRKKVKAS